MSRLNTVLNKVATLVMAHKEIIGNATMTTTAQTLTGAVNELDSDISSLNSKLNGVSISYCAPNSSVTAPTASKSYALIYGRRGTNPILAIAGQGSGNPYINVLVGTASWLSVSYNGGLIVSSEDQYTYLNVIWN